MRRSWLACAVSTTVLTLVLTTVLTTGSACDPFNRTPGSAGGPAGTPSTPSTPNTQSTQSTQSTGTASAGRSAGRSAGASIAGHGGSDGGGGGDDGSQFCALAKQTGAQNLQVFDGQSITPEQQRQVLRNIDALTAAAPDEIHADFARFDDFEHKLFDAGGQATGDLAQEAGGPDLRDALTRIRAYLDQHCDIHG